MIELPTPEEIERMPRGSARVGDVTEEIIRLEEKIGRALTTTEVSAYQAMHSEHASYASSRKYLKKLPTHGENHLKTVGDEAAATIIGYAEDRVPIVVAYSSESHNTPSFVCAHPGAATGTGGNQRDNIALTATLPNFILEARRQSDPVTNPTSDPVAQHVRETTRGIADYANAMGIPHGDGTLKFSEKFAGHNVVNVMAVTVARGDMLLTNKVPAHEGNANEFLAIYIGKRSDDTGFGGTKFASAAVDMNDSALNLKAVQDPDPHLQHEITRGINKVAEMAKEEGWLGLLSLKDMGAAGLLCSTAEQLQGGIGVTLNGDVIPQDGGRDATHLLEAETQERFLMYAHESVASKIVNVFNSEIGLPHINVDAQATIIGRCNDGGSYVFLKDGKREVDVSYDVLTAVGDATNAVKRKEVVRETFSPDKNLKDEVVATLGSHFFKSDKGEVFSHYDSFVQGENIVCRGEGAAMLRSVKFLNGEVGVSAYFDSNTRYGLLDARFQAIDAVVRGAYRMALVGASIIGVTNNANYGRTDVPEEIAEFVDAQDGLSEVCRNWELEPRYMQMAYQNSGQSDAENVSNHRAQNLHVRNHHITINSGNCSLNKVNKQTGRAIPPTTIAGLIGWTDTPEKYATWDMKEEKSTLYVVGEREDVFGGTDYARAAYGEENLGGTLHTVKYDNAKKEVSAIIEAVRQGYVASGNDIKEGGLCAAIAQMLANTASEKTVAINLDAMMGKEQISPRGKLFSESYGVVMEAREGKQSEQLREFMSRRNIALYEIGTVQNAEEGSLSFLSGNSRMAISQKNLTEHYESKLTRILDSSVSMLAVQEVKV